MLKKPSSKSFARHFCRCTGPTFARTTHVVIKYLYVETLENLKPPSSRYLKIWRKATCPHWYFPCYTIFLKIGWDLVIWDCFVSSFVHCHYSIKTFIRVTCMNNGTSIEKAFNAMNELVEDKTWTDENILNNWRAMRAVNGYCTSSAGKEQNLYESLAHLIPNARAPVFKLFWSSFEGFLEPL